MAKRIAVIGLGLMGGTLARHLLAAGFSVTVHDIDPAKIEALVKAGGKRAGSLAGIASEVDVIMLSLPNSTIVNEVVTNALQLLQAGRSGLVLIDTSTPDPKMSVELAARLREKGIEMQDATISGTSEMFVEKDVIFLVGGAEQTFRQCESIYAAVAKHAFLMGANGAGAVTKLVTNLILTLNRMALAEGLTLARKAGLDPLQTLEVLKKSAAYSKAMDQKGLRMVKKQFQPPASRLASSYKDARLILALGASLDCPLPLISLTVQAMASEMSKGRSEWDPATIISFYDELANLG